MCVCVYCVSTYMYIIYCHECITTSHTCRCCAPDSLRAVFFFLREPAPRAAAASSPA